MAFKKTNRKAQAAIEFLMTYGWMLLVVLIVGALIFSFVDFGGLLPSEVSLNNNLQGDGTQVVAASTSDRVQFAFTYIGSTSSRINVTELNISSDNGYACDSSIAGAAGDMSLNNLDSGTTVNYDGTSCTGGTGADNCMLSVVSGQLVLATVTCEANQLISGDVLEGDIRIPVESARTGLVSTATGRIRTSIE